MGPCPAKEDYAVVLSPHTGLSYVHGALYVHALGRTRSVKMDYTTHKQIIRGLSCVCCLRRPCIPHHIDSKRHHHDGLVISLCWHHHDEQATEGLHRVGKRVFERMWGDEYDLLAKTWQRLDPFYVEELKESLRGDRRIVKRMATRGGQGLRRVLEGIC